MHIHSSEPTYLFKTKQNSTACPLEISQGPNKKRELERTMTGGLNKGFFLALGFFLAMSHTPSLQSQKLLAPRPRWRRRGTYLIGDCLQFHLAHAKREQ